MKYYKIILFFLLLIQKDAYAQNDNHLYLIQKEKKLGLIDTAGNIIYTQKDNYPHNSIHIMKGYYLLVESDKIGAIDITGKFMVWTNKSKGLAIKGFSDSIFIISGSIAYGTYDKDGDGDVVYSHGLMNKKGEIILKPQKYINSIDNFSEGLSCVGKFMPSGWKYGYIDTHGKMSIDFLFDKATSFTNGFALVKKGNTCSIINKKGEIIKTIPADDIEHTYNNGWSFKYKNKYGYISSFCKIVPSQFDWISSDIEENLIKIKQQDKYGYINSQGNILIKPQFDEEKEIDYLKDGLVKIRTKDYKYGLIDTTEKIIIPANYRNIKYENGVVVFQKEYDSCFGAMDLSGNIIIQPNRYRSIDFIDESLFLAEENRKMIIIDKNGRKILTINGSYSNFEKLNENLFTIYNAYINPTSAYYMLINKNGEIIIPSTLGLTIEPFEGPLARVSTYKINGEYVEFGYINRAGQYIWPLSK